MRTLRLYACLIGGMALAAAASLGFRTPVLPGNGTPVFRNLKVLPKNISESDLRTLMDGYNDALGVQCAYCHSRATGADSTHLDYASDEKSAKETARKMIRMTDRINQKFFAKLPPSATGFPYVTCMGCHRGSAHTNGK